MKLDIISLLRKGDKRTVHTVDMVVEFALNNTEEIPSILNSMRSDDPGLAMRAADAIQKIFVLQPTLIRPYVSDLFDILTVCDQKEIRWHLAQILPGLPMTAIQTHHAAEIWLKDFYSSESSIVKTFSMQAIFDVSNRSPILKSYFDDMAKYALDKGTPAMKSRAKALLAKT